MQVEEIVEELRSLGSQSIKNLLVKHGAREPFFGVKVEQLKVIQKRVKKNHELALGLYATGISDAMYLAGLIADDPRMSKADLNRWAKDAYWPMLSESTVPWVAAEGKHGRELALEWIDSPAENVAACGWLTLSCLVALKPDSELDNAELDALLERVATTIHSQPNRVRYTMNSFVIAVGSYVQALNARALEVAQTVGKVSVDMNGTSCKVPDIAEYIEKVRAKSGIGKKKKTVKC